MIKTSDGYELKVGMWVSDCMGTYEVKEINEGYELCVELREIEFDPEDETCEKWQYGDYRRLTKREAQKLSYN